MAVFRPYYFIEYFRSILGPFSQYFHVKSCHSIDLSLFKYFRSRNSTVENVQTVNLPVMNIIEEDV